MQEEYCGNGDCVKPKFVLRLGREGSQSGPSSFDMIMKVLGVSLASPWDGASKQTAYDR
jgi:hypothetical protein